MKCRSILSLIRLWSFSLFGLFIFATSMLAQNSGTITGTVVDAAGAVIP